MASPGFFARLRLMQPKQSVSKDTNALRIGILGAANIAPTALIGPAKFSRDIVVVSIAARDYDKAKNFATKYDIPNTHPSYDALINDPNIDCIYNPLPNGLHYEWTKKALLAGKHVLLEKPATSNAEQAQELVTLAREKNLVLLEAVHYRFHPASIRFREILQQHIAEGHSIIQTRSVMSFPSFFHLTDIRFNWNLAGGIGMDSGCYTLNSTRYFTGLEVDTYEHVKAKIVAEDIDGRMDAVMNLKGSHSPGAKGVMTASLTNPWLSLQTWQEVIPKFTAETDDKIFTFGVFLMPGIYHYMTVMDKKTGKTENLPKVYEDGFSSYKYQLDAFVKAVKSGKRDAASIPGWVSGEDTILNMQAIDGLYKAAGMKIRQ